MTFTTRKRLPFREIPGKSSTSFICDIGDIRIITNDIDLLNGGEMLERNPLSGAVVSYKYSINLPANVILTAASDNSYVMSAAPLSVFQIWVLVSDVIGSEGVIEAVVPSDVRDMVHRIFEYQTVRDGKVETIDGALVVDTFLGEIPTSYSTSFFHTFTTPKGVIVSDSTTLVYGDPGTTQESTDASDLTGILPVHTLPDLAIVDTHVVDSEATQLALTVQKGDVAVRTDLSKTFINRTGANTAMSDWQLIVTPADSVQTVNGKIGNVVLVSADIAETTNLYHTETRVTNNANVAANTVARHTHTNKIVLDATTAAFTTEHVDAIAANTAKVGLSTDQVDDVVANTVARHTHVNKTVLDNTTVAFTDEHVDTIAANTAKVGITQQQADAIVANTAKVGITVQQADAIVANTAKVGITQQQADAIVANTSTSHVHANRLVLDGTTAPFTVEQADAIVANTTKVGITQQQADAIVANTTKVGITQQQADAIVANTTKVGITQQQADAIVANTTKVGITQQQADAIVANTAKVGITQQQADAIVANTAKVGITVQQADAIVANTAKVGITVQQADEIVVNASARHIHVNHTILDATTEAFTVEYASAIVANIAKETNVTTDLSYTAAATEGTVVSSDGTDATIPAATQTLAGLLSATDKTKLDNTIIDSVYELTDSILNSSRGSIQKKQLTGPTTFVSELVSSQSIVLIISGGDVHPVVWPNVTWVTHHGNYAPILTADFVVVLWQVNELLYGVQIGWYD